ncbi:MAG: ribosome maturation factor RimP [Syntrophorhabdaceae bacterium]|nr:ribosome maturation factor RimP [Syntrophorhabdaceae bacterium]
MLPKKEEILGKIEAILTPILVEERLELVDIEFKPSGKRWLLRIYIDKEGGVTISDCEIVNRELGRILDIEDVIEHAYVLEVSSPGLTRPLKSLSDFDKFIGRDCKVITNKPYGGNVEVTGTIIGTTENEVKIKVKDRLFLIPVCDIKKAHLDFCF